MGYICINSLKLFAEKIFTRYQEYIMTETSNNVRHILLAYAHLKSNFIKCIN